MILCLSRRIFGKGGVVIMSIYESVKLDRKGARQLCFAIIDDISAYCEENSEEFKAFCEALEAEETSTDREKPT